MKKGMTVFYEVDGALYVNLTNRCNNNCSFCIRKNGDGAYGSDPLWLEREPTEAEALEMLKGENLSAYRELVFCGYGEPTYRLDDAIYIAKAVKKIRPDMKIRINTNGHSDLILGRKTAPDYEGAFDIVSISLNTPSRERYQQICHSVFGEAAFDSLLSFAGEVKHYVPTVILSAVKETLTNEEIALCEQISCTLGVTLRLRDYIPPES